MGVMKDGLRNDWLPGRREAVLEMADGWLAYLTPARAAAWGVPAAETGELAAKRAAAGSALSAAVGPDGSPRMRTACRAAFADLKRLMRRVKNHHFHKPELEDGDFTALGLSVPGSPRAPVPPPEREAPFSMRPHAYMQVAIRHGRKLYGCTGALFRYAVLPPGAPEPLHEQLAESALLTRIVEYMEFPDTQEGYTLYGSLQWQNGKGDKGPPTPVQSLVLG